MKIKPRVLVWLLIITPPAVFADPPSRPPPFVAPLLHEIFQDHAVLQRDQPIPVWGDSSAGERVSVSIDARTVEARADAAGHWHALLPAMRAGGPYVLTVRSQSGAKPGHQRHSGGRCVFVFRAVEHGVAGDAQRERAQRNCGIDQ